MSDTWYYANGRERVGPVDAQALKAALAQSQDARNVLVWQPGFADWKRAGEVAELGIIGAVPSAPFGQADVAGAYAPSGEAAVQPGIAQLWFSFHGRINRAKFWLVGMINLAIIVLGAGISWALGAIVAFVLFGLVYVALLVSALAVTVKRLHDRNRSAWLAPVFIFGPAVLSGIGAIFGHAGSAIAGLAGFGISIWAFVELGCLPGTQGPNRFGPDPLGGGAG